MMRSTYVGLGLLAALLLAVPAPAAEKKDKKDKGTSTPAVDSDSFKQGGEFTGKLKSAPSNDGAFTVEVQVPHYELKSGVKADSSNHQQTALIHEQQKLAQLQAKMASARTVQQQLSYLQQYQQVEAQLARTLAQATQNPFTIKMDKKDVVFHAADTVKVRNANLPGLFDEKGNPKKYTDAEKAELKGKDKNLPGYQATVNDLTSGQTVKVTLHRAPAKKTEDKQDDTVGGDHKWLASMIMIQEEAPLSSGNDKDKDKKKKK